MQQIIISINWKKMDNSDCCIEIEGPVLTKNIWEAQIQNANRFNNAIFLVRVTCQ